MSEEIEIKTWSQIHSTIYFRAHTNKVVWLRKLRIGITH